VSASALPEFLSALTAALDGAPGMSGVQVIDGPPVEYTRPDAVAVGLTTEDTSVESGLSNAGLGQPRREGCDVNCLARSWSGNDDLPARRARVFSMIEAVSAVLVADPTVDGTVTRARVSSLVYSAARTGEGTGAFVEFRIRFDAYT
jgi:hypothetical protein